MENLLECAGRNFSAKIHDTSVVGKIQVQDNEVFLCQNSFMGLDCANKLGFQGSWSIGYGAPNERTIYGVTDFELLTDVEAYDREKDLIEFLKYIKEERCDAYGVLEIVDDNTGDALDPTITSVVREYIKCTKIKNL